MCDLGKTVRILQALNTESSIFETISNRIKELIKEGKNAAFDMSSFRYFISDNNRLLVISDDCFGNVFTKTGDLTGAYKILIKKLKTLEEFGFDSVMKAVYLTTKEYFGNVADVDISDCNDYYAILQEFSEDGEISSLIGKNIAACVERAALSQNLLRFLGIESVFKASEVLDAGKKSKHVYNLVSYDDKYYLFDATIPRIDKNIEITPIIAEISKEEYERLAQPLGGDDVAIKIEWDSVRGHRTICYNCWSSNVVDKTGKLNSREKRQEIC